MVSKKAYRNAGPFPGGPIRRVPPDQRPNFWQRQSQPLRNARTTERPIDRLILPGHEEKQSITHGGGPGEVHFPEGRTGSSKGRMQRIAVVLAILSLLLSACGAGQSRRIEPENNSLPPAVEIVPAAQGVNPYTNAKGSNSGIEIGEEASPNSIVSINGESEPTFQGNGDNVTNNNGQSLPQDKDGTLAPGTPSTESAPEQTNEQEFVTPAASIPEKDNSSLPEREPSNSFIGSLKEGAQGVFEGVETVAESAKLLVELTGVLEKFSDLFVETPRVSNRPIVTVITFLDYTQMQGSDKVLVSNTNKTPVKTDLGFSLPPGGRP